MIYVLLSSKALKIKEVIYRVQGLNFVHFQVFLGGVGGDVFLEEDSVTVSLEWKLRSYLKFCVILLWVQQVSIIWILYEIVIFKTRKIRKPLKSLNTGQLSDSDHCSNEADPRQCAVKYTDSARLARRIGFRAKLTKACHTLFVKKGPRTVSFHFLSSTLPQTFSQPKLSKVKS